MKRLCFILCIITFALILSSCRAINITSADELLCKSWQVSNESGISGELTFDIPSGNAELIIKNTEKTIATINGMYAVDSEKLYITSDTLCKTYSFSYKVFKDRVVIGYNGVELTFFAENEKEP